MKILHCLPLVLLAAAGPMLHASDSKRTAEYILTTPADFEGKEVTLDVSFVKPVHWKSPVPELAFFHVMTLDRRDYKPGGEILVVIPSEDASHFAQRYGTDFKSRSYSNPSKALLSRLPAGGCTPKSGSSTPRGKLPTWSNRTS